MDIVFVSNYYNHHQQFLCEEINRRCDTFRFISTSVMREERRKMGYNIEEPDYVLHAYEDENASEAKGLIRAADVVIVGAAQGEFSSPRLYRGKTVFYYSERLYRVPPKKWLLPLKAIKYRYRFMIRQDSYLLSSGAFTAADFARTHTFRDRCFKWGYFPQTKIYDIDALMKNKDKKKILWCGRLLDLKHPEYAVEVARRLRDDGVDFSMDIVGDGVNRDRLSSLIDSYRLNDLVTMTGAVDHETVRTYMESAGIFLFTSNRQEGWGAVLNESMNSGCAVAASHAIGSVPFLLSDDKNGMIFADGDVESLYQKVRLLVTSPDLQETLGRAAYMTIVDIWNAEVASERFLMLSRSVLNKNDPGDLFSDGPCSHAELLQDDWINGER